MYCVLDLETESKEFKGRKGNPWANKILAVGLKYQKMPYWTLAGYFKSDIYTLPQDYMPRDWLNKVTVLIGHNIKFDLLHIWRNDEIQDFFRRGGRIWDTQLAEYILTGQRHKYAALRDIAVNKYLCKERIKNIEKGLKEGLTTEQMDIEDLLEDVKNDVLDTEAIVLQQVKIAKETDIYNLILLEMDSLLATTEMEFNGMYINKEVLTKNKLDLQIEYENKKKKLLTVCVDYWR